MIQQAMRIDEPTDMSTLAAWGLEAVMPDLPEAIVPRVSAERLLSIAPRAGLPTRYFGFDCALGGDDPTVDFGFPVEMESLIDHEKGTGRRDGPVWAAMSPFVDAWLADDSEFGDWVPFLFLEFDEEQHGDAALRPSVFAALDWPLSRSPEDDDLAHVALEALGALQGQAVGEEIASRVRTAFERVAAFGGGILHVGAMQGRPGTPVRLSALVDPGHVWDFLTSVGWEGSVREGSAELAGFLDSPAPLQVDFDVTGRVGDKLGFTLQPHRGVDWRELLDRLVGAGLCLPARAEALLDFEGTTRAELPEGGQSILLRREITYLKWSHQAEGSLAKAYFSVIPAAPLPEGETR